MRIKIVSDLHTEFLSYNKMGMLLDKYIPPQPEDCITTLVIAGDLGVFSSYASTIKPALQHLALRFERVLYVPGNHEWYSSIGVWGNEEEFFKTIKLPSNVYYLDGSSIILDSIMFFGACLWTDFDHSNPVSMMLAGRGMNDYQCIRKEAAGYTTHKLQPEDTVERHQKQLGQLKLAGELAAKADAPLVVISHHAPSYQSVGDMYKTDPLNPAFASKLEDVVLDLRPTLWIHGHMHDSKDYWIGDTRVLCNPLGYHAQQINPKFNPDLIVEL